MTGSPSAAVLQGLQRREAVWAHASTARHSSGSARMKSTARLLRAEGRRAVLLDQLVGDADDIDQRISPQFWVFDRYRHRRLGNLHPRGKRRYRRAVRLRVRPQRRARSRSAPFPPRPAASSRAMPASRCRRAATTRRARPISGRSGAAAGPRRRHCPLLSINTRYFKQL